MVAFPLAKLIYMGIRQLSKPISVQLRSSAAKHPFVSRYICAPPAQFIHRLDTFVKLRLMGMKGKVEYKPLSEERAVEQGSEFLGETFLYSVAAGYIVYEYWRSGKKEQMKEDVQNHDISTLQVQVANLEQQMTQLQQTLNSLRTDVHTHFESRSNSAARSQESTKSKSWWIL